MGLVCSIILKWQCPRTLHKNILLVLDSDPAEIDSHFLKVFCDHYPIKTEFVSKVSETICLAPSSRLRTTNYTYVYFIYTPSILGSFYRIRPLYKIQMINFCLMYNIEGINSKLFGRFRDNMKVKKNTNYRLAHEMSYHFIIPLKL